MKTCSLHDLLGGTHLLLTRLGLLALSVAVLEVERQTLYN